MVLFLQSGKASTIPEIRHNFWAAKFEANVERDRKNTESLQKEGWRVIVVWECALKGKKSDPDRVAREVNAWLRLNKSVSEESK